jgi:hypothetical protein
LNQLDDKPIDFNSFSYLDLVGQGRWIDFDPTFGSLTVVGATDYSGRWRFVGAKCEFQAQISAATSIASVAGTTYMNLPTAAVGFGGEVKMYDATTNNEVGGGGIDVANGRAYLPLQPASSDTFVISGWYER